MSHENKHNNDDLKTNGELLLLQEQVAKKPKIKSRNERNAESINEKKLDTYKEKLEDVLDGIVIHNSLTNGPDPFHIQRIHLRKGRGDIGYHFIINKKGEIFEGRNLKYIGAHAGESYEANEQAQLGQRSRSETLQYDALRKDPDFGKIGIVVIGSYGKNSLNSLQEKALTQLSNYLKNTYHISSSEIMGHSNVHQHIIDEGYTPASKPTLCPGKKGNDFIHGKLKEQLDEDTLHAQEKKLYKEALKNATSYSKEILDALPKLYLFYIAKGLTIEEITAWLNPPKHQKSYMDYSSAVGNKFERIFGIGNKDAFNADYSGLSSKGENLFSGYHEVNDISSNQAPPFIANLNDISLYVRNNGEGSIIPCNRMLGGFVQYGSRARFKENRYRNKEGFVSIENYKDSELVAGVDIFGKFRLGIVSDIIKSFNKQHNNNLKKKDCLIKVVKLRDTQVIDKIDGILPNRKNIRLRDINGNLITVNNDKQKCSKILLTTKHYNNPQIIYGGTEFLKEGILSYIEKYGQIKYFQMDNGNFSNLVRNSSNSQQILENSNFKEYDGRNINGGNLILMKSQQ